MDTAFLVVREPPVGRVFTSMDKLSREEKEGRHQVQHAFHSGWGAGSAEALANADALRRHMAAQGLDTDAKNWAVYSDPREWQVLKEKNVIGGEVPPSMRRAAKDMARSTMGYVPTVWHGHSQGGAQLTTATKLAAEILAADPKIVAKAEKHGRDPEELARKRLAKYNMMSYSGAAMYPASFIDDATFAHKPGDPVSSAVVDGTTSWGAGDAWRTGAGREKVRVGGGSKWNPFNRKYAQLNIGNHFYNANYAQDDAESTRRMLERTGRLDAARPARPVGPEAVRPLDETTRGKRVADGENAGPVARRALMKGAMWLPKAVGAVAAEGYGMAKDSAKDGVGLIKGAVGLAQDLFSHHAE